METEPKSGPNQEPKQSPEKTKDTKGLGRAYVSPDNLYRDAQGTFRVASERGGFLVRPEGSHKIYGPGLVSQIGDLCGKLASGKFDAKDWFSDGDPWKD